MCLLYLAIICGQIAAPFKPDIKNETDVSYFDTDFTSEKPDLTPPDDGMIKYGTPEIIRISCIHVHTVHFSNIADPKAHVGDGVHFHDFTFAPEGGENFN